MASHKNQHFVPRCYLKAFTLNDEGFSINLYNIDRRASICNAAVKGQCAGSYFYGDDLKIEKLLQRDEGLYSQVVKAIKEPRYCLREEDKKVLKRFCLLQHCRTEAAAKRAAQLTWEVADIASDGNPPPEWKTSIRDAVLMSLRSFVDALDVVEDLKVCLVRNLTPLPFITSDDPAILANRWYAQNTKARNLSTGVGNAGALFLLPLTPTVTCVIYDGDVYSMPHESGWVFAKRVDDIRAINEHQFLGCAANIYFAGWNYAEDVAHWFEDALPRRPVVKHEVVTAVLDGEDAWGKRYRVVPRSELTRAGEVFIHMKSVTLSPSRWPSIIHWRSKPKIYSNGSGTGYVRRASADPEQGYRRVT
jgi:hypothetical protein